MSRKGKKHSKKSRDINGSDRNRSSPAIMEVDEPAEGSPKKTSSPVKFYIDDHEDEGEKETLIKTPEIVVDPPSRPRTPDMDDSNV